MNQLDKARLFEGITHINPEFVEEASLPLKRIPARAIWLKRAGALAASLVFLGAMLFSLNAAFPAFAESLPLVGEVFRRLNSLGAHASTYDGLVQTVGASGENDQYKAAVTEAYCDGEYVFLALRLNAKDTKLLNMEALDTAETGEGPGWAIEIDGESAGLQYSLLSFTRKGYYFESEPIQIKLPVQRENGEILHISARIDHLVGHTREAANGAGQVVSKEPVCLSFDLEANTGYHRSSDYASNCAVADGLALTSWSCSPSKFSVTLAYPYFGAAGVFARARTEDGVDLGEDIRSSGDFGDGRYALGDTAAQDCTFTGPPEGTEKVIVTIYKDPAWERRAGAAVFGEFVINLETGEAAATSGYLEEGFEHLPMDHYAEAAEEKGPERTPAPSRPSVSEPPWF